MQNLAVHAEALQRLAVIPLNQTRHVRAEEILDSGNFGVEGPEDEAAEILQADRLQPVFRDVEIVRHAAAAIQALAEGNGL